ncbi:MAG: hypothetical protein P1S60_15240 [Anaerolineae bacterium]|nr:hypothetical protein [Anaerolineae bacterium]
MENKKRKGCGCYLIIFLVVIALFLTAWVVVVHIGLLEKLGLRQPVAERLFAPPPDREAADALMGVLQQDGMDMQGVGIYVLPMAGRDGSVAILTLDASQGFDPEKMFGGDGGGMGDVFDPDTLQDLNIKRLAFDYVDDRGKSIATLTVPTEVLQSSDDMDEKEFLRAVMGRIDIPGLMREVTK